MRIKIKKALLLWTIIGCTVLTGCTASSKVNQEKNTATLEKESDHTLVYGSGDYTSINPALYEHGEINSLIFSGLTGHNAENKIVPDLAKQWTYDEKTHTYTFELRDDVKWHDGKDLQANDVKFTLESIMNPDNQSEIASNYEDITNIQVIDEYTIKITLKEDNAAILDYLTIGILPEHLLKGKNLATDAYNQNPIGTGPFVLDTWDQGQSITLTKNENYYKDEAKLDKVIFKIVPDTNARALQLLSGELDLAQITPKDAKAYEGKDSYMIYTMKTADYRGILYNFNHPLFKENKGLVNALSYAIDRQGIIDSVLLGHGIPAYSPLQAGPYHNDSINKFTYDETKAKEELEKLGWKIGKDGIYEKDGKKLSFTINCMEGDQVRIDMAAICAQQFKKIGVDVKAAISTEIDWANQEAFLIGFGSPFDPDDHTYKVFGTDKGSNYSAYSNPVIDDLLQKARETSNEDKRITYYNEFQEELTKDMPFTFIAYIDSIYASKKQVKGLTKDTVLGHHGVGIFWNIAQWTME